MRTWMTTNHTDKDTSTDITHHTLNRGAFSLYVRSYRGMEPNSINFHFEYVYHPLVWLPNGTTLTQAKIAAARLALQEAQRIQAELEAEIALLQGE